MESICLKPGMKMGRLTLIECMDNYSWHCVCDCGNHSYPAKHNLIKGRSRSCGNCGKNHYSDLADGETVEVISTNGVAFYIDKADQKLISKHKWHVCTDKNGFQTVITSSRKALHRLLMGYPKNCEVDHIDLDRLNNRRNNLRLVSHQQNQCNQPLQKNNTSGVSGVNYYKPRKKYRARIKIYQQDIHLGYYATFQEAVQARNFGMQCMFGEYGFYNDVPSGPEWIKEKVIAICSRFVDLSICEAFILSQREKRRNTTPDRGISTSTAAT